MSATLPSSDPQSDHSSHSSSHPKAFQTTHWSLIQKANDSDNHELAAEALETLCQGYWQPIYSFLRRQGLPPHEAQDITQGFFTVLLEKNKLQHVDQARGRFRSFLLKSLKNYHANERAKAAAQKRGGSEKTFSLDQLKAEQHFEAESSLSLTAEQAFDRKWAQSVIEHATRKLREEYTKAGSENRYAALQRFLLCDPKESEAYQSLAEKLNLTESGLRSAVHRMRRRFAQLFHDEIANTVSDPTDIADEVSYLWKVLSQ